MAYLVCENLKYLYSVGTPFETAAIDDVSFSANQHEINSVAREIVKEAQNQMTYLGEDGLHLNMGTFTGIPAGEQLSLSRRGIYL